MKRIIKVIHRTISMNGLNVMTIIFSIRGFIPFIGDLVKYWRNTTRDGLPIEFSNLFVVLADRYKSAGQARGHYFFQDLWAAKKIYSRRPARHVDIGSSVEGFVSHLLVFMDRVEVVDIRALESKVAALAFVQDDATHLNKFSDNSLESISSLHAAEHFGLGRYGDPVDPEAHLKFMSALARVLKPGGRLYFSVPTGVERLEFNAHRILSPFTVMNSFKTLDLVSFSLIKDDGYLYEETSMSEAAQQDFGCGLYEFTKPTR